MQHIDADVYYFYLDELEKCGHITELEKEAMLKGLQNLGTTVATKFPNFTKAVTELGTNAQIMSPSMALSNAATTATIPALQKGVTNLANRFGKQSVSLSKNPEVIARHAAKMQRKKQISGAMHSANRFTPMLAAF